MEWAAAKRWLATRSRPRQRAPILLALLSMPIGLAITAPHASAHATTGQIIMAGRNEAVSIVVNAETETPMTGVDVVVPHGFDLVSTLPATSGAGQHWPVTREGNVLHYRGVGIPDGGTLYIEVMGQTTAAGILSFNTTTKAADGTVVNWNGPASSDHPAALVQVIGAATSAAGSSAGVAGSMRTGSSAGHPPWMLVMVAAGVLMGLTVAYARRRRVIRV